jgi:hypothetical protein
VTEADIAGKNAEWDTPQGFVERAAAVDNVIST